MKHKKILFIDHEHLLQSETSESFLKKNKKISEIVGHNFCPYSVINLEYLLSEVLDLKIVITGKYRLDKSRKDIRDLFLFSKIIHSRLLDETPMVAKSSCKGDEISKWLSEYNPDEFLIIDDPNLINFKNHNHLKDNFISISRLDGFTKSKAYLSVEHFKEFK